MAFPKMGEITDKFVGQPYDLNSVLSPSQVWSKLDAQSEEVRVFTNSLIDLLNSTSEDNWLYTAIVNAILGQITDGSLTDVKLSDEAGQIKERLTTLKTAYDAFIATKAAANGLASLGSDIKVPIDQLPVIPLEKLFIVSAGLGTDLFYVSDGAWHTYTTWTKYSSFAFNMNGSCRMSLSTYVNEGTSYLYFAVNGIQKSQEFSTGTTSTTGMLFTFEFTDLVSGDTLEVWVRATGSMGAVIKGRRISIIEKLPWTPRDM